MKFNTVTTLIVLTLACGSALGQLSAEDIAALRAQGEAEGWTFSVELTEAATRPISELCGAVEPADWRSEGIADPCTPQRDLPEAFDWRDYNACTPVRNQGGCGSCWAFGAIGAVESAILRNEGVSEDLAEQWLISCTAAGDCDGGWHSLAFGYLMRDGSPDQCSDHGAVLETEFPYEANHAACDCPYSRPYWIESWAYVASQGDMPSTNQLKQAILDHGPVTVGVYVNGPFSAYGGGVFNACEAHETNHMVVLVGWDDTQGTEGVWILRNSWGPWWGEDGYMLIEYGCSRVGSAAAYVNYPQDCNDNGIWDLEDIAGGTSFDCNDNNVPDECDPQDDCNSNGRQDICDVAYGYSPDCNSNEIPDECEPDCDNSGVPDECEPNEDCNGNGVQDICDIAGGTSEDCNNNSRPDECDLLGLNLSSTELSPIGGDTPQSFTIVAAPAAVSDVTLSFSASADLNNNISEWIDVDVNGVSVGSIFTTGAFDCPAVPNTAQLVVPAAMFNAALTGADAVINMVPTTAVNSSECSPPSFITVSVQYLMCLDCNDNGVPDDCEPDCNANGVADECDIRDGASVDCGPNGVPDECDPDTDNDGVVDDCDPCPLDRFDDSDDDGACDSDDECPIDPNKITAGQCGCGQPETDSDGDGVADCVDLCPGVDDAAYGPLCAVEIPTTSKWGLVVLVLLLITAAKLRFTGRVNAQDRP